MEAVEFGRGGEGPGDRERRNRAHWDRISDRYQTAVAGQFSAAPAGWGAWGIPEAELRLLPEVAGLDVLDFGCGAASWAGWLAEEGARVAGIDLSGRRLEHARRNIAAAGAYVHLIQGNGERLPFGDASFDLVLSDHGVMSWGHPDRTVPEVARVLRPDGMLVFCVSAPLFHLCWDDERGGPGDRLLKDHQAFSASAESDGGVHFMLSHGEWVRRFRAHGLAVEALVEPKPATGVVSTFWPQATDWVRRWPAELIWKVRREAAG